MIKKITIIGSGNVATQLSLAFKNANIKIVQIISRNKRSGSKLAKKLNTLYEENVKNLINTDLVIVCVNDDEIIKVVKLIPDIKMVHTSGSTHINALKKKTEYGVFYPIQSLNKELEIDFNHIPICIEANNKKFEKQLIKLAKSIVSNVISLDSKKRKHLHLSAVIASNFSNFSYLMAKKHLDDNNIDFKLLKPLIIHTANKIINNEPLLMQTGPAKRGDKKTINEHLSMLKDENFKKIYKLLSNSISKEYGK